MNRQETILKKIQEIAEKIETNIDDSGLLTGKTGAVLWYFYLSRYMNESYYEIAENLLIEILDNLKNTSEVFSHCSGYSGICWALMHLKEHGFIDMDADILDDTDEYLFRYMINFLNQDNWDFLHGASGVMLYLIKKRNYALVKKKIDQYIETFVEQMNKKAIDDKEKEMKWKYIHYFESIGVAKGVYNIGLSHGMSSLLVIFTKIYLSYNKSNDMLRLMIEKTAQYIINQRIDEKQYSSCFPSFSIETEQSLNGSRMAWCYGDLGISMALWQAGEALNKKEWCQVAIETMKHATTRKIDNSVKDAGMCHGTAGLAHIFNRMFQYTKIEQFKLSCEYWIDETLKMAKFDDGIAGYKTHIQMEGENFKNEHGLLMGVSGIGLCLLSNIYKDASAWDECLLLS